MDITNRIRTLATSVGLEIKEPEEPVPPDHCCPTPPDRCWVDARVQCPYGSPEGQFINRPELFCNAGCQTFGLHVEKSIAERVEEESPTNLRTHFMESSTTVVEELQADAEQLLEGSPERLVLELAVDVVKERKLDRNILLEDDLPVE